MSDRDAPAIWLNVFIEREGDDLRVGVRSAEAGWDAVGRVPSFFPDARAMEAITRILGLERALGRRVVILLRLGDPSLEEIPWEALLETSSEIVVATGRGLWRARSRFPEMYAYASDFPEARGQLFPSVTRDPDGGIEADRIVRLVVRLAPTGPSGLAPIGVDFPSGAPTVALRATVSSSCFTRPDGETWEQTFSVDRHLTTVPAEWELRARALGDRPFYALTIAFDVGDTPAGAYEIRIPRRGAPAAPGDAGLLRIPSARSGAALVLAISAEGPLYRLRLKRHGVAVADAIWSMGTEAFFNRLDAAKTMQDIRALGFALYASLPGEITSVLDDPALDGLPMLIASGAPVAPFELLRVRPRKGGPHLAFDRPVLRWTDNPPLPDAGSMRIRGAATIRPEYAPPDDLPSAAGEEQDLAARFPELAFTHVGRQAQLDALLQAGSVHLVHFAGHADGNPARLSLEDANIEPTRFDPDTPLMNAGPFFFLNGCRAGTGRTQVPEFQANLLKMLLVANGTGAVAPLTKVDSTAARAAARAFYEAAAEGQTVGEAALAVRKLALGAGPNALSSFLSYLVFAPPRLALSFERGLMLT